MAKVKLHPAIQFITGKMGEMVFRHIKEKGEEKVELADAPTFAEDRVWTEKQVLTHERMRQAVFYGKSVMLDENVRKQYEEELKKEGKSRRRLFSLLTADFLKAPSIDEVDLSEYDGDVGDKIKIRAHDDFKVTKVEVGILDADGKVLEKGEAKEEEGLFVYTAQTNIHDKDVKIDIRAYDMPKHIAEKVVEKKV
jgi:hypothetical protein